INHYVRLYTEKCDELEKQRHLHVGLDKLKDTVAQVEELHKSLAIKRSQLEAKDTEANDKLKQVRVMANLPEIVKIAMESVCTIQGIIHRDDFILRIVNFDTTKMTKQLRDTMKRDYISWANYNSETVNFASKACVPLVKWALAQVRFSEILDKVEPLRNEVQSLEDQAETTKKQAAAIISMIGELEAKIARYKEEYALLISQTQATKSEMECVQSKVDRSMKLLASLSSEREWSSHLTEANIKFKPELAFTEYLSTADDRLGWQSKSLPSDNLTTENAIMLKRFNRYPLIIDPTGQATTFLLNEYKDRKITVTSFLDATFLKVLESAFRFGNPLLIQDVEHLDPILNAVLNKEIRRTGGCVLIRLGNQDINFSPAFTMFLFTRDPSVEFSPDIYNRYSKRNGRIPNARGQVPRKPKANSAFACELLKIYFCKLNESTGNILDDDKIIDTLETLKREVAEITHKVEETDVVMREVEQVTAEYLPLAQACSSVFFVLEQLVNHFHQFSLHFFLDIFDYVLHHNPNLNNRTSRALLHRDNVMLAVLLSQVRLRGLEDIGDELEFLLESGESIVGSADTASHIDFLTLEQQLHLGNFAKQSIFQPVLGHIMEGGDSWIPFLESNSPETSVPTPWEASTPAVEALRNLLIVKCFRPDRLLQSTALFVRTVFQTDLSIESTFNLGAMVVDEVPASTPVVLISVPGYDASYRVENLIQNTGARSTQVAIGFEEGFTLADQAIAAASRQGSWVLLKNVHLAPSWLGQLEKKLQTLNPHRNFRLFLTMEANPSIPVNILRQSHLIMNEPSPGIKENLLDSFGTSPLPACQKA
ncbi:hypothetical protein DXG01_000842, partial [Tephrocybe rancida]